LAPRIKTPSPETLNRQTGCGMPEPMLAEQVQRLAVSTIVGAGLWTFGLVMDGLVRPNTVGSVLRQSTLIIEVVLIIIAAVMFAYVRLSSQCPVVKSDVGLAYFVVNAAGVALLNNWAHAPVTEYSGQLSWNTVTILVGAMIIPSTPSKMLATA